MKQEDVDVPIMPPLLDLLLELMEQRMSVFIDRSTEFLHITPPPSEEITTRVRIYFAQLAHLLPGICEACDQWSMKRVDAYWDAHPHLCLQCRDLALEVFEEIGQWPTPNFEEEL